MSSRPSSDVPTSILGLSFEAAHEAYRNALRHLNPNTSSDIKKREETASLLAASPKARGFSADVPRPPDAVSRIVTNLCVEADCRCGDPWPPCRRRARCHAHGGCVAVSAMDRVSDSLERHKACEHFHGKHVLLAVLLALTPEETIEARRT